MLTLYAITTTVAAITCAAGWLGCRRALREERRWSAHYRECLMRREKARRQQSTAEHVEAWLREAGR